MRPKGSLSSGRHTRPPVQLNKSSRLGRGPFELPFFLIPILWIDSIRYFSPIFHHHHLCCWLFSSSPPFLMDEMRSAGRWKNNTNSPICLKKIKTHTQRCVCVCGENVNLKIRCKITSGTLQWQRRSFLAQKSRSLLAWSWYLVTFCHFVVFCGLCWPLHGSISTSKPFFPTQKKKCFYSRFLEIFHCVTEWRQVKGKRNSFISFPLIRWPRLKVSFIVCIGQQSDAVFGPPMASRAIQPPTCRQMKIRLTQMKLRFLKENIDF